MVKQVLIDALTKLLRPLVRITLRQGLSAEAFEEVVRRVYVDVAEKDFSSIINFIRGLGCIFT